MDYILGFKNILGVRFCSNIQKHMRYKLALLTLLIILIPTVNIYAGIYDPDFPDIIICNYDGSDLSVVLHVAGHDEFGGEMLYTYWDGFADNNVSYDLSIGDQLLNPASLDFLCFGQNIFSFDSALKCY